MDLIAFSFNGHIPEKLILLCTPPLTKKFEILPKLLNNQTIKQQQQQQKKKIKSKNRII
jgi:hypothetical protein